MTAATVINYEMNLPGFACGKATGVKDTYTIDTGLGGDVVFIASPVSSTDDIVVTVTSQSDGVVTVGLFEGGSAYSTGTTLHWFAFLKKGDSTVGNNTYFSSSFPNFACGVSTLDDGDTVTPFLNRKDSVVFVGIGSTDDTLVTVASQSAGVVTLGINTAGAGASSELIHWIAIATLGNSEQSVVQSGLPGLSCGMSEKQDGETIDTGLGSTVCCVCCAETGDTSVVISSQTNGVVTLLMDVNGVATASDETVQWIAFHEVYK